MTNTILVFIDKILCTLGVHHLRIITIDGMQYNKCDHCKELFAIDGKE